MKTQIVEVRSYHTAAKRMPWACKIAKVSNGFIGFESIADYRTWKKQK